MRGIPRTLAAKLVAAGAKRKRPSKYSARKVEVDGVVLDSAAEARRYRELLLLQRAGLIRELSVHRKWRAEINGQWVAGYTSDFDYYGENDEYVVEDVKSGRSGKERDWPLRKRLIQALFQIRITEVKR